MEGMVFKLDEATQKEAIKPNGFKNRVSHKTSCTFAWYRIYQASNMNSFLKL